ncbi:MAG: YIP1 family protein [Clostridia bacterium]|nr:YIP1 family protein [Clostridia bacterium]
MKRRLSKFLILSLILAMLFGTVYSSAFSPYETYTYSIDGEPLKSPTAYAPSVTIDYADMNLEKFANGNSNLARLRAADMVTDEDGNVILADRDNNRVVVLNKYYSAVAVVDTYEDEYGTMQTFLEPDGVYVTNSATADGDAYLYVCDTGHARIVIFDENYNYIKTISKPESTLIDEAAFKPQAMAVDKYGRIFVVSPTCTDGVIVMSSDGDFTGFIGAQKVTYSVVEMIWKRFQTREQRENQISNIPVTYNNITVDDHGFVYVTNSNIDESKQLAAIKTKNPDYSPVKKLNSAGVEIMKRNGFFDPGGEVAVSTFSKGLGVSKIIDVAIGEYGSWSILDKTRSRIFTYDENGNLLFAFGDYGDQLGNGEQLDAITYQNIDGINYILSLDGSGTSDRITVYSPTEYCDTIMAALKSENEHKYSDSILYWEQVLTQNNNFDLAYIGIGKALYSQGKYDEAMEMLSSAYETEQYSKAFAEIRKDIIGTWLLPLLILVIALCVGLVKFLGWAKKKNKATSLKVGRKTYLEELLFVFHLSFHPFDGFWDLKHEKRGSVRGGFTILGITIIAFFYQAIGRGYIFNPRDTYSTVFVQVLAVAVPVILWCLGNWCLTTLFEGEGSFKDIFIATTYSLAPLPLFVITSTILTNVLVATEGSIVSLLVTFGYIWVALLLFFGMLVTHDYSLGKNVLITICTIVAMAVIMFVAILFSSLVMKMATFVISIITEIANRA